MNDVMQIRDEFAIFKKKIHLDVAFKCPLSKRLVRAMEDFLSNYQQTGGDKQAWLRMADNARAVMAGMINARPEEIAFVKNTSEGINIAAWGIGLKPGDNIILNDLEHTNNVQPWLNHQRFGVTIRWVRHQNGRILPEAIEALMDDRTRVVSLSSVQYTNGFRADLRRIGNHCRESKVLFVVDAIQQVGVLPLDIKACKIDVLCCGGHKFLLGPHGIGLMYVSASSAERIMPPFVGLNPVNRVTASGKEGFGKEICFALDARKFEYGYLNFVGIAGLMASADMLLEKGINSIEQHVLDLNRELVNRLQRHGAELITPIGEGERSAIVVIRLNNPKKVSEILEQENIIATIRDGTLRISFHFYNSLDDFDPLIECLIKAGEIDR